jgi:galactonate dehydratase
MTTIKKIDTHIFHVSSKTNWVFISIEADDQSIGWGEASLNGWELVIKQVIESQYQYLIGKDLVDAQLELKIGPRSPGGLVASAAVSAIQQALLSLISGNIKYSENQSLGKVLRKNIPVYANINRATQSRTPEGFVETAIAAKVAGFTSFKLAPFDGLLPNTCESREGREIIHKAIDCIYAVRDTVGKNARLMVDCHWRFNESAATDTIAALRESNLYWFECPLVEVQANYESLRRIRAQANSQGTLIAAAETQIGVDSFRNIFSEKIYDLVMPDVKYCGGPLVMLEIANLAAEFGVKFAPHNPTGPICHLHSAAVAAVASDFDMLEVQFNESHYFNEIINSSALLVKNSNIEAPSNLDISLNLELLKARPFKSVPYGIETLLNS